jgi:type IV pilus assembly protein PilY1
VVYDGDGVAHVVVTESSSPTPKQLTMDDQVFKQTGSGATSEIFKKRSNGSYGTKQSWHELIQ